jgi:hypothetical protein
LRRLVRHRQLHEVGEIEVRDLELAIEEIAGQRVAELARALIAMLGILGERAQQDLFEGFVDLAVERR